MLRLLRWIKIKKDTDHQIEQIKSEAHAQYSDARESAVQRSLEVNADVDNKVQEVHDTASKIAFAIGRTHV